MTTLTVAIPAAAPTWPAPSFDRWLTHEELDLVIARIRSTEDEHGIVAALAVFDVAAADRAAAGHGTTQDARTLTAAIPLHQWREIQAVIDSEARRRAPGGESAVLSDWVEFGPRISAR